MPRALILVALLCVCDLHAGLRAGAAKVDITPAAPVPLWGYMNRLAPAEGTLDPLYARALVLEAAGRRVALVSLDLGRPFGPASTERLRAAARARSRVDYVFLAATHTHAAPVILNEYPEGRTPAWETEAVHKIVGAIETACGRLAEAAAGAGRGSVSLGYNRRRVAPDGAVTMLWKYNEAAGTGSPVDPTVSVVRIDAPAGRPLAVLLNYACHPVHFGSKNLRYSAEYPAAAVETVEDALPGAPLCLFLQGAAGDINPFHTGGLWNKEPLEARRWTGAQLGAETVRVAQTIRTEASASPDLQFSEDTLTFERRWDKDLFRRQVLDFQGSRAFEIFASPVRDAYRLPVSVVLIDRKIALTGVPGEPFLQFQMDWRRRCPAPFALYAGYANGYEGYFPTIEIAAEGGYGAANVLTWVAPGAGERMLDHALVRVYEMLGRFTTAPAR